MEYIQKSIYSRPEIRCVLMPLWPAWALAAVGAVCAVVFFFGEISEGGAWLALGGMFVGGVALLTVLCYWLFGDSRRPYHRTLHVVLEPTYAFYAASAEKQIVAALEAGDECALDSVKRQTKTELLLIRYSDKASRICYSQLMRIEEEHYIPLTNIIINEKK